MTLVRRRIEFATVVAASAALALAGCASSQQVPAPAGATSSPTASVRPADTAGQTPRQYAGSQASAMLRAFTPSGARRVNGSPAGELDNVEESTTDVDKNLVDQFTDWTAPGTAADVLAQVARHVPAQYTFIGSGTFNAGHGDELVLDDVYQLPPIPGVLNVRELDVSVVLAGTDESGKPVTGIRVDAAAGWVTGGPVYHWLPATARVMTLTETRSAVKGNQAASPPRTPATVTNATQVQDIVSVINGMSPLPPHSSFSCPMDSFGSATVTLTFRAQAGGPELATAVLPTSGCAFTGVAVNGKPEAGLLPGDGAKDVLQRIQRITGLAWAPAQP